MTNDRSEHLYVHCAVRGALTRRAVSKLPPLPDGSAPRALPLTDDISLVVSDVAAATYSAEAIEARLADLDWVSRCGAAHHAVVDQLSLKHTVVPFRLFTLFSSEPRARSTLGRAARRIDEALKRVKGKAEWVLRIGKPDLASTVGGQRLSPGNRKAAASVRSGTEFLKSKAAAKYAALETAARVRRDAAAVFAALSDAADQATQHRIDAPTALLLDAAFLVPVRQTAAFKRVLSTATRGLLDAGCRVSLTGPWPPYSFAALASDRSKLANDRSKRSFDRMVRTDRS